MMIDLSRFTKGYLLIVPSAGLAVLSLLMPWISFYLGISDEGVRMTFHLLGIEIVGSGIIDTFYILSIIICMMALGVIAYHFYHRGRLSRVRDGYIVIAIFIYCEYTINYYIFYILGGTGIGSILMMIAFFFIGLGGAINLQELRKTRSEAKQPPELIRKMSFSELDPDDIESYPSTKAIFKSRRFTASERQREYRRRGKSPSGVIDGVYNDAFLEPGQVYNDFDRDWDADA